MMRLFTAVVAVLCLAVGVAQAAETKGKAKSVDADKGVLVVTVDGKDKEFKAGADTEVLVDGMLRGKGADALHAFGVKSGLTVTVVTEKETVKQISFSSK